MSATGQILTKQRGSGRRLAPWRYLNAGPRLHSGGEPSWR